MTLEKNASSSVLVLVLNWYAFPVVIHAFAEYNIQYTPIIGEEQRSKLIKKKAQCGWCF
jgi:hypothetical protein